MFREYFKQIKKTSLLRIVAGGLMMIFLTSATPGPQNDGVAPETTIRQYFEKWQGIVTDAHLSQSEKDAQFRQVIEDLFYIEILSRQCLNKKWQKLSSYDRQRFGAALKASIANKIKACPLFESTNGDWTLNLRDQQVKEHSATLDFNFASGSGRLDIRIYMQKNPQDAWKVRNVKIGKNSLLRHYYGFCKKLLDDYSFAYLVAELGDKGYVVLEDFESGTDGKFPPGWSWKKKDNNKRKPYLVKTENGNKYLEATDKGESVIIGKKIKWNLKKYRYISFKWRAHRLPEGGDERFGKTVDSAAGIYFTYKKKLGLIPKSVKFVWSTTLPVGSTMLRTGVGKPWMVVAESGPEHLGEWRTYIFDAYQAYKDTFGGNPPNKPIGIGILSDANSTHSLAYADYDDIRALKHADASSGVKEKLDAE